MGPGLQGQALLRPKLLSLRLLVGYVPVVLRLRRGVGAQAALSSRTSALLPSTVCASRNSGGKATRISVESVTQTPTKPVSGDSYHLNRRFPCCTDTDWGEL